MQKTIKIALASSFELKEDRREFEIFISRKNKSLSQKGIFLELIISENFIDAMSQTRLQDEYNKAMQQVDIFVMLFFTKVGKYTLEEFENAFGHFKEHGRPLVYTYFKDAPITTGSLKKQNVFSLFAFQERLSDLGHYTSKYPNIGELKYQFSEQLEKVLPGLIPQFIYDGATEPEISNKTKITEPKPDIYYLPKPTTKLIGRTKELKKIESAFNDYNTHIFAIIAAGGIGKSALIDEWLVRRLETGNKKQDPIPNRENSELEAAKDKEIARGFGWSFYSQVSHDTQTSSAQFFEQALPFWDYKLKEKPLTDDTAKGRKLAELLRTKPSLLILDGLEPLQNNVLVDGGRLKDTALAALLRDVERNGLGKDSLIIISSRQPIVELSNSHHYQSLDLQRLSSSDGVKLLKSLNIKGLQKEMETAVEAYGGHALALVLLGKLLVRFFKADVNQHVKLSELLKSPHTKGKEEVSHAERVMSFYNKHWSSNAPERCFLNLLGLFDRPMGKGEKDALLERAEIAKPLATLSELDWQAMLNNLQDIFLLLEKNENSYDTHPLIRTYFGEQFQKQSPSDWKQAHLVLFEYFQSVPEKTQPDTLEGLEPLYRAVVHGCLAGEYQKALDDVYRDRIRRGSEGYTLHKLGAYAQDLTAISAFFPEGWDKPVSQGLSEADQAWLLAEASFCLMSLGRLSEAVKPRQATLELFEKLKDWGNAASTAGNLMDLLLPLGSLNEAKDAAEKAILFADRTDYKYMQIANRSRLAATLHKQGNLDAALKEFKQVEELQKKFQPEYAKLCSLPGAHYCALLLDLAKDRTALQEVLKRGRWAITVEFGRLLNIAFDQLTIARALFSLKRFDEAKEEFDQAVAGIRKAGTPYWVPVFLLERAKFLYHQKGFEQSQADLDEAKEIIERCDMKLYDVDAALLQAKLNLNQNKDAQAEYEKAEQLIKETGYHLRNKEFHFYSPISPDYINPYPFGVPVSDDSFLGRTKELNTIINNIDEQSYLIDAQWRMGKTSLLYKIRDELFFSSTAANFYYPVFLALGSVQEKDFWFRLYEKFRENLRNSFGVNYETALFQRSSDNYSKFKFKKDIREFIALLSKNKNTPHQTVKFVVIIDEAQIINSYSGETKADIRDLFSQDMELSKYLSLIMAGYQIESEDKHSSPWINFLQLIDIAGLDDNEFETLLKAPLEKIHQAKFSIEQSAIDKIALYSNKIPYDAKVLCNFAFSRMIETKQSTITKELVEEIKTKAFDNIFKATNGLRGKTDEQ